MLAMDEEGAKAKSLKDQAMRNEEDMVNITDSVTQANLSHIPGAVMAPKKAKMRTKGPAQEEQPAPQPQNGFRFFG